METGSADRFYLGLDLGTNLGLSMARNGVIEHSEVIDLWVNPANGIKRDHDPRCRLIHFHDNLVDLGSNFDAVFFERVNSYGAINQSIEVYYGLKTVLEMWSYYAKIPVFGIHLTHLKKVFTGDHKAKKNQMCATAHMMGWQGGQKGTDYDHDEADAIAALVVGLKEQRGIIATFPKTQTQE